MTFLVILLILITLGLYGLKEYYQIVKIGAPPQKTSRTLENALIELLQDSTNGSFLNLGSGYGGLVLGLAKRLPAWEIHGVEMSPTPWLIANLRSIGKNMGNYRFHLADALQWPLRNYDIIFIQQNARVLRQWESRIARQLQPDTILIVANTPLPRARYVNVIQISDTERFYIYRRSLPVRQNAEPVMAADSQPDPQLEMPLMPPVNPAAEALHADLPPQVDPAPEDAAESSAENR